MAVIATGSDPVITGTADADIIFQGTSNADPVTIEGGSGNDAILGNRGGFLSVNGGGSTLDTAFSADSAGFWNRFGNALVDDDTIPYTSLLGVGADTVIYCTVTVGAGETITADMDFAFGGLGGPSWDSRLQLLDSDGTTVLVDSDDSDVAQGGFGSTPNSATSTRDSYLQHTNGGAAAVTLYIVVGAFEFGTDAPVAIPTGNAFLLNLSVSNHAEVGSFPAEELTLNGGGGRDFLLGNLGADTITGGRGSDQMVGGAGDDRFVWREGDGSDTIDGGDGTDTLNLSRATSGWTVNLLSGAAVNGSEELRLTGIERVVGTDFADVFTFAGQGTRINAGDGNDTILGGVGTNILNGEGDFDIVSYADATGDVSVSLALQGTRQNTGVSRDTLTGIEGLTGSDFDDTLTGSNGDDRLSGLGGLDTIVGGKGGDTIDGGGGADTITGGRGTDILTGGGDIDTFRFTTGDSGRTAVSADTITDFTQSDGDRIHLATFDAVDGTPEAEAFRFIGTAAFGNVAGQLRYEFDGVRTLLEGDTDGDGRVDVTINLTGDIALTLTDFIGVRAPAGQPIADIHANPAPDFTFASAFARAGLMPEMAADLML